MVRDDLYIAVPSFFRRPISLDVMKSPVSLCTGVTYDRTSIQRWPRRRQQHVAPPPCKSSTQKRPLSPIAPCTASSRFWSDSLRPPPGRTQSTATRLLPLPSYRPGTATGSCRCSSTLIGGGDNAVDGAQIWRPGEQAVRIIQLLLDDEIQGRGGADEMDVKEDRPRLPGVAARRPDPDRGGSFVPIAVSDAEEGEGEAGPFGSREVAVEAVGGPELGDVDDREGSQGALEMASSVKEGRAKYSEDGKCVAGIVQRLLKVSDAAPEHAVTILWSVATARRLFVKCRPICSRFFGSIPNRGFLVMILKTTHIMPF
ncbi:hypothetical protein L3X38_032722 [Prunus dulcis]|uniref:U-box domain-containing protein n=1 Tax=Prunus dulcis TaxID=3755 RepID=A0AAD4YW74_PRUDU|nr:hypothetical protein L3X38_032722 [Prunus dulcis]